MVSVTQRIKEVKQPRGGYLPPKMFLIKDLDDGKSLNHEENIHSSLVGLCVDYLVRFMNGASLEDAFRVSLKGAFLMKKSELAFNLLSQITCLDDISIISACQLVGFDVVCRAGQLWYKPVENIIPDKETILNIRIMVERSLEFFKQYGPIVKDGFIFLGGYTDVITTGDGDFLTSDTLWDFKVSKQNKINKDQSLQLLIYYLMGIHSVYPEFQCINKLGIYNPRQNSIFTLNIADISSDIIEAVKKDVIGY